jgi:primosomal protein N' (replication factor Y)
VIVQTFQPDARPIVYAARHDVAGFLSDELERRRALGYPPYGHLIRLLVSGSTADAPLRLLTEIRARLEGDGDALLGPAALGRLRNRHRAQLIVKTESPRRVAAHVARLLSASAVTIRRAGLTTVVDVDPQSF